MKRFPVNRGKDRRIFTRTGLNTHFVNFQYLRPQRGGRRM